MHIFTPVKTSNLETAINICNIIFTFKNLEILVYIDQVEDQFKS